MKEIARTPDAFKLSIMKQLLESHGIYAVIMDEHVGSLYHGIATMTPRLMVPDDDFEEALEIIKEAESQE